MSKLAINFNEEATTLTDFVGIIGDSKESQQVLTTKIGNVCQKAFDNADTSNPRGISIDRKQLVKDTVDAFTPEEILLLAIEALTERIKVL